MVDAGDAALADSFPGNTMRVRFGAPSAIAPHMPQFLHCWRKACGDRAMPRRVDIDPSDIPPDILPNVILSEALDGGARHRYRLVGTEVTAASRRNMTGTIVGEALPNPAHRVYIMGLYETVMTLRRPLFSVSNFRHPDLHNIVTQRMMCPLSEDGVSVNMIFSCQVFDAHPDYWPDAAILRPGSFQKLFEAEIIGP
jgi:hypothetical protein